MCFEVLAEGCQAEKVAAVRVARQARQRDPIGRAVVVHCAGAAAGRVFAADKDGIGPGPVD